MRKRSASYLTYFFGYSILICAGLQTSTAQVEKGALWRDSVVTELDVDFAGTGFHSRWIFHRCDCGDLQIQVEQMSPDGTLSGELLMVQGQVLLSRGFEQQSDDLESLIQAPSLMLQLAYAMLNRSQPKGPGAVSDKEQWDETEKKMDFRLNTGLAAGTFAAPWGVKGSGWKTGTGSRRFELLFHFTAKMPGQAGQTQTSTQSITLSGDLDFRQQEFPYPESTNLKGWRIQRIASKDLQSEPVTTSLTLKELRQQARNP